MYRDAEFLVTAEEMRAYDTYTIDGLGIPGAVLMERAALTVTDCVMEHLEKRQSPGRVLCVCGTGNNGGDGLCVARQLTDLGIETEIALIGDPAKCSTEALRQLTIVEKYGILLHTQVPQGAYTVMVDALFGTGLSRAVEGRYKEAIEAMNESAAVKIAVDIPSGIHTDTGAVLGTAVRAEETVTFAFYKRGLFLYPGAVHAGKVRLARMGITKRSFQGKAPGMYTLKGPVGRLLPGRNPAGNKGTFGKVLLAAGSSGMAGAALLAGRSAYKTGCGMVKLVVPEHIREIIQTGLPEALLQVYEQAEGLQEEEKSLFMRNMEWADVIAIGPGLSICESGRDMLFLALTGEKPLIVDADGLNLLAEDEVLCRLVRENGRRIILTPHMGELARLLHKPIAEVTAAETASAMEAAERFGCIVAAKSARTHVVEQGKSLFLNTAGCDRMATAGSGDVLAGMITALAAQGMEPYEAAVCGVYLHACAGEAAAEHAGAGGLTASDMIAGLALL